MNTWNELIKKKLSESECLNETLAGYDGEAAIFFQKTPDENDPKWMGDRYPRIVFDMDRQPDRERNSDGTLTISILYVEEDLEKIGSHEVRNHKVSQANLGKTVKACLHNVFFQPDGMPACCHVWQKSNPFPRNPECTEITFDVYDYPSQVTMESDPILALGEKLKKLVNGATIMGLDQINGYEGVRENLPVLYLRILRQSIIKENYSAVWMSWDMSIQVHAFTKTERTKWIRYIVQSLAVGKEIKMADDTPMSIKEIKAEGTTDDLTMSQIMITLEFGILRNAKETKKLMSIFVNEQIIKTTN